ncbi:MAG: hypothetical protein ACKVOE_05420 [Rickettsiales bacterium]
MQTKPNRVTFSEASQSYSKNQALYEQQYRYLCASAEDPANLPTLALWRKAVIGHLQQGATFSNDFDRMTVEAFKATLPKTLSWEEYTARRTLHHRPIEIG